MKTIRSLALQSFVILALSAVLGLLFNFVRPNGLPLVYAQEKAVQLDEKNEEIPLKDAAFLFMSKKAVFLDARGVDFYQEGHIQGALSADVNFINEDFPKLAPQLEGKTVVTYCDGEQCELSHELAATLRKKGIKNVYMLRNGWSLWKDENLPTATGNMP